MHKEAEEELKVRLKLVVLELANQLSVARACKEFNVPRSTFYRWKKTYDQEGEGGLYRKKPVAKNHPRKTPPEVIEKILDIRTEHQFGAVRIRYYLERYHGIQISESTVSRLKFRPKFGHGRRPDERKRQWRLGGYLSQCAPIT